MPDTIIAPSIPTVPVTPAVLDALRAIVGERGLILDEQGKQPFVTDWRGQLAGNAAVVVRPNSTEEVAAVVKLCYDNDIAIVTADAVDIRDLNNVPVTREIAELGLDSAAAEKGGASSALARDAPLFGEADRAPGGPGLL